MVINAYEYLFYKLYQWSMKVTGRYFSFYKIHACIMMSVAFGLNIITLIAIIYASTGVLIVPLDLPTSAWAFGGVLVVLGNYVYFTFNGRYQSILNRYKGESRGEAKRGNIIVTAYVIGSFVLLAASGFLGIYINQLRHGI